MINLLVFIHVVAGVAAIIGMIGALSTRKGANWHKNFGSMYVAYSGEDDRHFRGNVTDGFNLLHWKLKRNVSGHDQSTFSVFS